MRTLILALLLAALPVHATTQAQIDALTAQAKALSAGISALTPDKPPVVCAAPIVCSATPSPDGTRGTSLVDPQGHAWSIDAQKRILIDGKQAGNGAGSELGLKSGTVYALGTDGNWWKWGSTWTPVASPFASDFDARSHGPGVVRFWSFDSDADLHGPGAGYARYGIDPGTATTGVIDHSVSASGGGSLRFDMASQTSGNAAGSWHGNFSDDLSVQFDANSEFFVQWRQRFNPAMVTTRFMEGGQSQGGIKQAIITAGDRINAGAPYGADFYASCEAIGVVVQTYYQRKFPIAYDSCTGSASHGPYAGFYESINGNADFGLQNVVGCKYSASGDDAGNVGPGCVGWVANEWMTFKVAITTGPRVNGEFVPSRVRMWIAREGKPSQLVIDWKPGVGGYFPLTGPASQSFGKVYLLPYMTNKDSTQVHPLAQTWYDELIVSRQDIPDPK